MVTKYLQETSDSMYIVCFDDSIAGSRKIGKLEITVLQAACDATQQGENLLIQTGTVQHHFWVLCNQSRPPEIKNPLPLKIYL